MFRGCLLEIDLVKKDRRSDHGWSWMLPCIACIPPQASVHVVPKHPIGCTSVARGMHVASRLESKAEIRESDCRNGICQVVVFRTTAAEQRQAGGPCRGGVPQLALSLPFGLGSPAFRKPLGPAQ